MTSSNCQTGGGIARAYAHPPNLRDFVSALWTVTWLCIATLPCLARERVLKLRCGGERVRATKISVWGPDVYLWCTRVKAEGEHLHTHTHTQTSASGCLDVPTLIFQLAFFVLFVCFCLFAATADVGGVTDYIIWFLSQTSVGPCAIYKMETSILSHRWRWCFSIGSSHG